MNVDIFDLAATIIDSSLKVVIALVAFWVAWNIFKAAWGSGGNFGAIMGAAVVGVVVLYVVSNLNFLSTGVQTTVNQQIAKTTQVGAPAPDLPNTPIPQLASPQLAAMA